MIYDTALLDPQERAEIIDLVHEAEQSESDAIERGRDDLAQIYLTCAQRLTELAGGAA